MSMTPGSPNAKEQIQRKQAIHFQKTISINANEMDDDLMRIEIIHRDRSCIRTTQRGILKRGRPLPMIEHRKNGNGIPREIGTRFSGAV